MEKTRLNDMQVKLQKLLKNNGSNYNAILMKDIHDEDIIDMYVLTLYDKPEGFELFSCDPYDYENAWCKKGLTETQVIELVLQNKILF